MMMTKLLEKGPVNLNCPHCKEKIQSAWVCKIDSFIGIRFAFLCNKCEKLLGIAKRNDYTLLDSFRRQASV